MIAAAGLDICVAQVGFENQRIDHHLDAVLQVIGENREADLIVFPELILHGHPSLEHPEGLLYRRARVLYGPVSTRLYREVEQVGARVIFGQIHRKGDELRNVATYVDGGGRPQHYAKTHVHWTESFTPGNRLRAFDTPFGPVGINICFDAAFPEVWRVLALKGARLIVNISAVPAHFSAAYVERRMAGAALDNQVFVVYANRPEPAFSGRSAVYDPHGERVAEAGTGREVFHAAIDLNQAYTWRQREQIFPNRRPGLYRPVARRHDVAHIAPEVTAEPEPVLVAEGPLR